MKHFLRMNNIKARVAGNRVFFLKNPFAQKLFLYIILFSTVFSARFFYEDESREMRSAGGVTVAFAASDPISEKKTAGHRALLDINRASLDELLVLPGVGPKLAEVIVKDRELNGPFQNADALLRVKGIGPKKLEKISPLLRFEASK